MARATPSSYDPESLALLAAVPRPGALEHVITAGHVVLNSERRSAGGLPANRKLIVDETALANRSVEAAISSLVQGRLVGISGRPPFLRYEPQALLQSVLGAYNTIAAEILELNQNEATYTALEFYDPTLAPALTGLSREGLRNHMDMLSRHDALHPLTIMYRGLHMAAWQRGRQNHITSGIKSAVRRQ